MAMVTLLPNSTVRNDHVAGAQSSSEVDDAADAGTLLITNRNVSGTYDYQGDVKVTFPEGWTGIEVSESAGSTVVAAVAANGVSDLDELDDNADAIMFLVISQKRSVVMAPGSHPPLIAEVNKEIELDCTVKSSKFVLFNGIFSERSSSECTLTSTDGSSNSITPGRAMILKTLLVQTLNTWVSVTLYGAPEDIESNLPVFEAALKTARVISAKDFDVPFGLSSFEVHTINTNGSDVHVEVKSSSNITSFALDEGNRAISFRAEGPVTTDGVTEISIGRVLEGPYIVTVNGEISNDFDVLNQESLREEKIQLRYEHGISDITIKGAQVVPEFPFSGLLGTGAALATTFLAGALTTLLASAQLRARRALFRDRCD